jgi:hypothetical protein
MTMDTETAEAREVALEMKGLRDALNAKPRYFVPAGPEFWLLELCEGVVTRTPVVAWEIRTGAPVDYRGPGIAPSGCFAIPVTASWNYNYYEHNPVLCPDGKVRVPDTRVYGDEAAWLEGENERYFAEAKAKAAQAAKAEAEAKAKKAARDHG